MMAPQSPSSSTRWCPTPEQLMILEEMYRSGVRTPNASQIQQITAHLSGYGRIEGKNVFYWFQNHKARERQKLRRRLSRHYQLLYSAHPAVLPHPHSLYCLQQEQQQPPPPPAFPLPLHHAATTIQYSLQNQETNGGGGQSLPWKMELLGNAEEASASTNNREAFGHEWTSTATATSSDAGWATPPWRRRPLRTLDLFPTTSATGGGIKDNCTTSFKSSS